MCGICGIVDFTNSAIDADRVRRMADTIAHRGPDDDGVWVSGAVGLGHRRLSIIDLSDAGHQPMFSPDGKVVIVYNGEVYNFPALRARLEGAGVTFRGGSDTEVILHAYLRWGEGVFAMLDGMFAIALWDGGAERLYLARDRFGIKPLYVHALPAGLVFGSEIKALLASGRSERELHWQGLHEYLYFGNALGRNTLFAGIEKLPAGHYLTLDRTGARTAAYWSLEEITPIHTDVDEATHHVRTTLRQAVRDHLIADVPVGVFLSGGIDSSAITALASQEYAGRIRTYSVGFDFERGVDELPNARLVAEHFDTDHTELHLAGGDMADVIERLVRCHDEPFGDAANIPLYLLCEQLRGEIKVILQGDGGDEIFAGYRRYNVLAHERFWRTSAAVAGALPGLRNGGIRYDRARRFFHAVGQSDPALRYAWMLTQEPFSAPPTRLLSAEAQRAIAAHDPFARYREVYAQVQHLDAVQRALYTDSQILLPDTFLEKVDKSTMAHSVEIRVPMLDNNLTSYVMGLESGLKVRNRQKKWILRRALRGLVPDAILNGKKTGFGVPYGYWLREPLAGFLRAVLLDRESCDWGLWDSRAMERTIDEHVRGERNHGYLLYKLLNLGLWRRAYLTAPDLAHA